MPEQNKIAVFGGGCFWCTEAVFSAGGGSAYGGKMFPGIISVTPGYAGGAPPEAGKSPTYEEVSAGGTGHAEVVRVEYNQAKISYRELLTIFFAAHDPTTLNKQGSDKGAQYRSIILYYNEEQKKEAEAFIKEIDASHPGGAPVVTEIQPLKYFYRAEEEHRDYYKKNPYQPYCQLIINPKLEKVQKEFAELLKK
ncbi:peptide-methionine (S)-S-oxide reductase [Candidatus Giovannonibacteria bacterium RIFCSPHIGHO2_01_FULL_45_33]|uniref:Peptide methionine sulfoxide reductase MsrA n=1 Tax=Candidatus Giovannonibacteria bacterium RIFCSPLOWO2_01_FULL_45_34 TaxID=1798351 RepID=A0A1F5WZH5_9BACT|nr:MAG: peptide-methionine (S)-S-oxide reductase [Candidatus Giovannonibacteria bacterium RIFCSPHIGHO2_01_FULL_45_33]OGF69044.1 MAG: peptide-methionine (S)-S-oxide reductase [Candidatus Giovannonibacteria bacterium RIFCSPHIGHO2_02_FULL_44_11]OGF81040.1 MAG: peptide-methionine (S)-S-oxide reductase [Candidatus Giovannonibacteria bacterium RIFCSPLOWO2_01_FULL_45_34]